MKPMNRLARWFQETGTDKKDLAERCDVSAGLISQYVIGRTKPSFDTLVKLSRETGLSIAELVEEFEPHRSRRSKRAVSALSA